MNEFLIRGRYVVTMAGLETPGRRNRTPGVCTEGVLTDGAVHVRGTDIVAVDSFASLHTAHPDLPVHGDGTGVVIPGLVSTHTHLSEGLATGMGSELSLFEWGGEIVGPVGNVLTRELAEEGTALRAVEMLLSGVTTVNDMFCHANFGSMASLGAVDGLRRAGMRGIVAFGAEDAFIEDDSIDAAEARASVLAEHRALADHVDGDPLVGFRFGVGTLLGQTDELLADGVEECRTHGWAVHTHLAEVREEITAARQRWGHRSVEHAEAVGLLERPLIAAHGIWLTDSDIDILARHGASIAHSPVANMILGSGVCPLGRLRSNGIAVGIGTDGAASNDSQDMLGAIKAAALLQKVHHLDPLVIDAFDVLTMATIEGARALGLDDQIGSLEPAKRADVVLLQDTVDISVLHDPVSQLVYGASPRSVRDVWVHGNQVVADHRCVTIDEADQIARCRPLVAALARDAGLIDAGHSVAS